MYFHILFGDIFPLYIQLNIITIINYKSKVLTDCYLSDELLQVLCSDSSCCSLHVW